jgi:hypothetical protein
MSAPTVNESQRLFCAYRVAHAEWELEQHNEVNWGVLPDDIEARHCDNVQAKLMAYLLHPSEDLLQFSLKLRTFHEEDGTALSRASEIIAVFADDIRNIAFDAYFPASDETGDREGRA